MDSENRILVQIKTIVCQYFPDADVILFGSRARGDNTFNSDFDLLLVVKASIGNRERLHYQALIRKTLTENNILADIIIHSASEIEIKRNLPGHIVISALLEGVRV